MTAAPDASDGFEELLEFIRDNRGFDFTGYKRPSLRRRIAKRMEVVGIESFGDYLSHLEANQDEFAQLFDTILINVTRFFRDEAAWQYVREEIVPRVVEQSGGGPVRVWSAGCASGEEAYSIAMVLAEAMGEEDFRSRVKVYATDVDEHALREARHALFTQKALADVPEELRGRYFEPANGGFLFRGDLRRTVIFGRHDLVRDPPISRVNLLVARNTLMYFDPRTQGEILGSFHFSLTDDGFLFLGKSEVLLTRSRLFQPVHLKHRVFAKTPQRVGERPRLPAPVLVRPPHEARDEDLRVREAGFEAVPVAQLVVDAAGRLALANQHARRLFGIAQADLGLPLQDVEVSYRPLELRSRIEEAKEAKHPVSVRDIEWQTGGETLTFDVHVTPLVGVDGGALGTAVTFTDVTRYRRLQVSFEESKERLETAYEELQSTAEELETTNEELQSTNEELETTNEELQSTNEELETMNEELQSTNEELETMNDELRLRTDDLNDTNAFLESVLESLRAGVVVVNAELVVLAWSDHAAELWGLRSDEVRGRHLQNLDIGLPLDQVAPLVRACLTDGSVVEADIEAINRRGRTITCLVRCSPLRRAGGETRGVIVQMEERRSAAE